MSETCLLPVHLTEDELRERGAQLAKSVAELSAAETKAKDEAKERKKEVDQIRTRVLDLARVVSERKERRPVEVIERFDVLNRLVRSVRMDTGEEVGSRPMSLAEVAEHEQKRLSFVDHTAEREKEEQPTKKTG